jgi:hypothetical protein
VKIKPVKLLQEALGPALPLGGLGSCLRPRSGRRLPKNRFVRKKKRKKKRKKEGLCNFLHKRMNKAKK